MNFVCAISASQTMLYIAHRSK